MTTHIITSFSGEYRFLSNFHPVSIIYEEIEYPSLEHAYQASKVITLDLKLAIRNAPSAADAKRIGKGLNLRTDFDRVNVMRTLLKLKFSNVELREKLLRTGNAWLVEGNNSHDNFFGACHCDKCENLTKHNHLGKLLMEIREQLRDDEGKA